MTLQELVALVALTVVLFLAFQIGDVLMRVVLALVAIVIVVWLISRLFAVASQ